MWSFPRGTINKEKIVFAVAAAWLCLMGVRYHDAPRTKDWGPPRTFVRPPLVDPHHFQFIYEPAAPGPEDGSEPDGPTINVDGNEDAAHTDGDDTGGTGRERKRGPKETDPGEETGNADGTDGDAGGDPPRLPLRYVGTAKVGYGDRWIIFEHEQDSRYFAVRSGRYPRRAARGPERRGPPQGHSVVPKRYTSTPHHGAAEARRTAE